MASINFFSEKIRFKLTHPKKTASWIKSVAKAEEASIKSLNYIFCNDDYLREINIRYLKHKTYTDIITFNYGQLTEPLEGDIFISIDRVKENALKFNADFDIELHRVIIHGVLHLIGFNDKSKTEKLAMREKEDTYLSLRS
jgi:probable rRNA maturation factor